MDRTFCSTHQEYLEELRQSEHLVKFPAECESRDDRDWYLLRRFNPAYTMQFPIVLNGLEIKTYWVLYNAWFEVLKTNARHAWKTERFFAPPDNENFRCNE